MTGLFTYESLFLPRISGVSGRSLLSTKYSRSVDYSGLISHFLKIYSQKYCRSYEQRNKETETNSYIHTSDTTSYLSTYISLFISIYEIVQR